jgi:integrase
MQALCKHQMSILLARLIPESEMAAMKNVSGIYDDIDQFWMFVTLYEKSCMMSIIFYLGIVSGLRIGDLLSITTGQISQEFTVYESKTGKYKTIKLCDNGWRLLDAYCKIVYAEGRGYHEPLFLTTRQNVLNHFKAAAKRLNLKNIGTHTMRKSYAWNVFRASQCIHTTRRALNHKYISTTLVYLMGGFIWAIARTFNEKPINDVTYPRYNP